MKLKKLQQNRKDKIRHKPLYRLGNKIIIRNYRLDYEKISLNN